MTLAELFPVRGNEFHVLMGAGICAFSLLGNGLMKVSFYSFVVLASVIGIAPGAASACERSDTVARSLAEVSLLTDASHPESPLALVREEGIIESELIRFYRLPGASLIRLSPEARMEGGESDREFIRFVARIPALSDHFFFVVVARDCSGPVYNYGFN